VNARDALPPTGGRIVVSTSNAERLAGGGPLDGSDALAPGGYVVVAVTDNGSGMDDATLGRAFEPFFTTKEFGKGSGLGLAQVWGFARAAGGVTKLVSAVGKGTTVEL